jgi:hypothetical protein
MLCHILLIEVDFYEAIVICKPLHRFDALAKVKHVLSIPLWGIASISDGIVQSLVAIHNRGMDLSIKGLVFYN